MTPIWLPYNVTHLPYDTTQHAEGVDGAEEHAEGVRELEEHTEGVREPE
jgi:hypothetical protein